jgi:colanic acid biosynthesis glycosyl transferase WcaI
MRILHLGINYWPDETGIAPFATGRCEYLAACGHDVVACVGLPYYPRWRVPPSYKFLPFPNEQRSNVKIARSWMYVPQRPTSPRRILHEISFVCSSLLRAAVLSRPDLIFITSPPLALGATGAVLSRLWGVPYVFHVADLQPDAAVDLGMLDDGLFVRTLYRLEMLAYRYAALVSTLTEAMREKIIAKGIAPEKVALFSDWIDPALFTVAVPQQSSQKPYVVAHFGNMGVKQGLGVMIDAAAQSHENDDVVYRLVGDGAARRNLEDRSRKLRLHNVEFLPLQPRDRFLDLLSASDVCLVTQQENVADIVFPSKVITLLAAARPLIASVGAGSEVARVVVDSHAGLIVPPGDPHALRCAVDRLRAQPHLALEMGQAGRAYALKRWQREAVLSSMEKTLAAVAGDESRSAILRPETSADAWTSASLPLGSPVLGEQKYPFGTRGRIFGAKGAINEKSAGNRRWRLYRSPPGPPSQRTGILGSRRGPEAS